MTPTLPREPEPWVTVSRPSVHFHGQATAPVLHRPGCRYVKAARADSVAAEETISLHDVYYGRPGGSAYFAVDRFCKVCIPEMREYG